MQVETLAERESSDCGCPEHDIMLAHISATVHLEPDGTGEAFVGFGDWNEEWSFQNCIDIEDLKSKTWDRFQALPQVDRTGEGPMIMSECNCATERILPGLNTPQRSKHLTTCPLQRSFLFYNEIGLDKWVPVPESLDEILNENNVADGEQFEITFKRLRMTQAEFDAIPQED